jgi:TolA-binding protein
MNHDPQARSGLAVTRLVLAAAMFLSLALTSTATLAQSAKAPLGATAPSAQSQAGVSPQSPVQQPPASPDADLAQMRTDLDRMESLLGNMSSEIEFLRDQNLQILLRTNAQMWRMLISDLRRQVDREEQQRSHR